MLCFLHLFHNFHTHGKNVCLYFILFSSADHSPQEMHLDGLYVLYLLPLCVCHTHTRQTRTEITYRIRVCVCVFITWFFHLFLCVLLSPNVSVGFTRRMHEWLLGSELKKLKFLTLLQDVRLVHSAHILYGEVMDKQLRPIILFAIIQSKVFIFKYLYDRI